MDLARENLISQRVIGAAIEVHRELGGPGLLEAVYEAALCYELSQLGLCVERQVVVPVEYKGELLESEFKLDLLVERTVVVELKAVVELNPVFKAQVLTYLRLMNLRLGLVVNFGQAKLVDGVCRVIN